MTRAANRPIRRLCRPGEASDNVVIDKEFASLIPPLSKGERRGLHDSLDSEGCRDALLVWQGTNKLVDGHNRLAYCREKGYPFGVIERPFADREAVKAHIVREQLGGATCRRRRRATCAASVTWRRSGRARNDLTSPHGVRKSAAARLAEEFGVGEKTIGRDGQFARAVDRVAENCGVEARPLLLARSTGLTRGGLLWLVRLDLAEQREALEVLRETGRLPQRPRQERLGDTLSVPAEPAELARALLEHLDAAAVGVVIRALAAGLENERAGGSSRGKAKAGG